MILVTEKIVAGLDIFVDDIVVMAISQSSSSLKGNTTELHKIAVQVIFSQRTTTKVFH